MEQLYNLVTGALSNSVSASATNIPLTPASLLPVGGTYRILVDAELMIVTEKIGNTLTVTRGAEGTIATTHAANAVCYVIASAGGLIAVRQQSVAHANALLHKDLGGGALALFSINLDLLTASRTLIAPNKSGILATLEDVASGGLSPATVSALGGIIVGDGLEITPLGLLSTTVTSVNGMDNGAVVLDAGDVGAVDEDAVDAYGGVAGLSPLISDTPLNRFRYGRTEIHQLPLGAVQAYGTWNPTTNNAGTYFNSDGFNYTIELLDDGKAKFTHLTDDFEAVVAGWIFQVTAAATVTLDDYTEFFNGDIIMSLNGKWQKIRSADTDVAAALALANAANIAAAAAQDTANDALALAAAQPIDNITDADTSYVLGAYSNHGHIFVNRTVAEGNIDIEIPLDVTAPNVSVGYEVVIHQIGAITGTATLILEDVAITLTGKTATTAVNDYIRLVKRAADTWHGY